MVSKCDTNLSRKTLAKVCAYLQFFLCLADLAFYSVSSISYPPPKMIVSLSVAMYLDALDHLAHDAVIVLRFIRIALGDDVLNFLQPRLTGAVLVDAL